MTPPLYSIINERYIQILISGMVAFLVGIESIPVIINISRLKNLMDIPGERSSHSNKTPTLGGVAIFASVLIGYFIWENPDGGLLVHLSIVGVVILFFLGVKDDILILSPVKKMIFQIVASSLVIIGADLRIDNFFGIFGVYEIPLLFSFIITVFIFIALINAMNLIDGIDGLGGAIGLIASTTFGIWFYLNRQPALACLAISLSGALLGFLRFNFSKTSKIFMGDTGSLISGFLLTVFAVRFVQLNVSTRFDTKAYFNAPILAIIVLIIPIFDTLRVFLSRISNRKSPFVGDRNHLHHILIDLGLSHFVATCILSSFTILSTVTFLILDDFLTSTQSMILLVLLFVIYISVCQYLKKKIILINKLENQSKKSFI